MKFDIPKKYKSKITEWYKDSDGYWAYAVDGYKFEATECHTAHGFTQAEFMSDIRTLAECNCEECEASDEKKLKKMLL